MTNTRPTRKTETRHHPEGKACHHFYYQGLTCDEYDALRARAKGHCEICGTPEEETPRGFLVIDHFHCGPDSFIRGLLCDKCNSGVMPCVDGLKFWGANREWEARAREYEANSWQRPSPVALAAMAQRAERKPKNRTRRMPSRDRITSIAVPSRHGVPAMADRLLMYLTPEEAAQLAALLSQGGAR